MFDKMLGHLICLHGVNIMFTYHKQKVFNCKHYNAISFI